MPQRSAVAIQLRLDKLVDAHVDQLSVAVTLASVQLGPIRDSTPSSPTAALSVRVTCGEARTHRHRARDSAIRPPRRAQNDAPNDGSSA
jgi:hypothetical protein